MELNSSIATITSGAAAGIAAAIPLSLLPGIQGDTFWIGMVAAFCVVFLLDPINTLRKSAASVLLSALGSGYMSPVLTQWVAKNHPDLIVTPDHSVWRMVSALVIAILIPVLIAFGPQVGPIIIQFIKKRGGIQ